MARALGVALLVTTIAVASQVLVAGSGSNRRSRTTTTAIVAPTAPRAADPEDTTTTVAPTTTSTFPPPPLDGPIRLTTATRVDGHGLGPVEAGMTAAKAEQIAGRRFRFIGYADATTACYRAEVDGLPGLRFAVKGPVADPRDGSIVRTEVTGGELATVSGIRVGASVDDVRSTYGGRAREAKSTGGGSVFTVPVPDGNVRFGVAMVASSRGVVTGIFSGTEGALSELTGCG